MSPSALFHALVGAYLRHEKGRTLLTVLGVALGVGVLVAIDLANSSAVESFRRTLNDVAGAAQLEVRGNGVGLPGRVVADIARHPEVAGVSPLIMGDLIFAGSGDRPTTETLLFLGVDLLLSGEPDSEPIRDIQFALMDDLRVQDLLLRDDLILLTARFAKRHGITPGTKVAFHAAGVSRVYTVAGVLYGGTLADTLDGNVAVADLASADIALRRGGLLDRIDLRLSPAADIDKVATELEALLGGAAIVERPETRGARVDGMLAAFRFNLRALGHISILVGAFLVFNTMSIAVIRRRGVIGTARAMGVTRWGVRGVFLCEGALIGLAGVVVGIPAGVAAALVLLQPVSEAISINFVQVRGAALSISPSVLLQAVLLGVGGSLLAAIGPANEAASTPPATTMRRGSGETSAPVAGLVIGTLMAIAGSLLLLREPRPGIPINGYLASTLLVGAFAFWSRPFLGALAQVLRRPFARVFRADGILAISATRSALRRSSVAITGLLVSVAMTIAVTVMVSSFRVTVTSWMEQVLVADLYISPAALNAGHSPEPMSRELARQISSIQGVEAVDAFRSWAGTLDGKPVRFGSGDFTVPRFTSRDLTGRSMTEALAAARSNNAAVVSESFALKHGRRAGDVLRIPTPAGIRELPIETVYTDYSSEQGYVLFDRQLYDEWFGDDRMDTMALYLSPGADRDRIRGEIRRLAAGMEGMPGLVIRANDDLRDYALQAFDQTFAVTHILKIIAILVSILGVATTLLSQVLDRREEVATLRFLGATSPRLARVIMLETCLVILSGLLLGIPAGLLLSWILTTVIMMESFGWTISFSIPWVTVIQAALVIFAGSLLAGVLPAREAIRSARKATSATGR